MLAERIDSSYLFDICCVCSSFSKGHTWRTESVPENAFEQLCFHHLSALALSIADCNVYAECICSKEPSCIRKFFIDAEHRCSMVSIFKELIDPGRVGMPNNPHHQVFLCEACGGRSWVWGCLRLIGTCCRTQIAWKAVVKEEDVELQCSVLPWRHY